MILAKGKVLKTEDTKLVLNNLKIQIIRTLVKPALNPKVVIKACDKLSKKFTAGAYDHITKKLQEEGIITFEQIEFVSRLLSKEHLMYKMKTELGNDCFFIDDWKPLYSKQERKRKYYPLGVLFHIAAGNLDGLPAYSVIEGLLVGNINILKLPGADKGLSILLLSELITIEPLLADYIYVFDTPSNDIKAMKQMAYLSDGIIVWGGDEVVKAVRNQVSPDKKIIEWGHKISFAYVTQNRLASNKKESRQSLDHSLRGLAKHIFETNQLLCSSCQGVYLDTNDMNEVYKFSEGFLKILEEIAKEFPRLDKGIRAQINLQVYNEELEGVSREQRIYKGKGSSIIARPKGQLQTSLMFGNCWTMPLAKEKIIQRLYRYRGYLQTIGLLSTEDEREEYVDMFARAGAVRIMDGKDMSRMFLGEAHDGEYPLRRYSRVVEY